jgi:hypothetical protein
MQDRRGRFESQPFFAIILQGRYAILLQIGVDFGTAGAYLCVAALEWSGRPQIPEREPAMSNMHPADALGALKAQIANLEAQAKIEHARLVAMGAGAHEGELFRASVSVAERESIDWRAVAEKLEPSRQLITAHTSAKEVTTVRVVARTGKAA